jgi:hypothetical protein
MRARWRAPDPHAWAAERLIAAHAREMAAAYDVEEKV